MSTDYFQNRPNTFEHARRRLESPGERTRLAAAVPRSETGPQPVTELRRPEPVSSVRTITWGTTLKISTAIYLALVGVLLTLALAALLLVRFAGDELQELKLDRQSLPSSGPVRTT